MKHWHPSAESYAAMFLAGMVAIPSFFTIAIGLCTGDFAPLHTAMMSFASPPWLFALLFAISGVRRASGAARWVAIVSLAVLVVQAVSLAAIILLTQM